VRAIFQHSNVAFAGECDDDIHISRHTRIMNNNNRLGSLGNSSLNILGVDAQCVWVNIR
jgi:hypothetical protein